MTYPTTPALNAGEALYPELWDGLVWSYLPGYSQTASIVGSDTIGGSTTTTVDSYTEGLGETIDLGEYRMGTATPLDGTTEGSIHAYWKMLWTDDGTSSGILSTAPTTTWANVGVLAIYNASGYLCGIWRRESAEAFASAVVFHNSTTNPIVNAITWRDATTVGVHDFAGSAVTASGSAIAGALSSTEPVIVGSYYDKSSERSSNIAFFCGSIWNRALTTDERALLATDPFAVYRKVEGVLSLTATNISAGTPAIGSTAITQEHAFGSQSITSGSPTLGQPSIPTGGNDALAATGIETWAPVLGTPTLTTGILGANIPSEGEHGGSPVLNDFTITPTALYSWEVVTPPTAGTLEIFADLTFTWDAAGVPDGNYTWVYRLYENGVSVGTATVYMHVGALAVEGITAGIPTLGTPAIAQDQALSSLGNSAGNPIAGSPTITQNHSIAGLGIAAGCPTLGAPDLTEVSAGTLLPTSIVSGAPTLGTPTITQNHALGAGAIAAGVPTFGPVTLAQQHAMMAVGVVAGAPTLGTPALVSSAPGGEVWPSASDVRLGTTYGPTGTEYTGTMAEGGGTYPTAESIAAAVVSALQGTTIPANIKQVNDVTVQGAGTKLNPWQPV